MTRHGGGWRAGPLVLAALCAGCGAPRVDRLAEVERFQKELAARTAALALNPVWPLTLADCEALALRNNLDYQTRLLRTRLKDEQVRLAMTGWLPQAEAEFQRTGRSNKPLVTGFGSGAPMAMEDQRLSTFSFKALIPIFDFGTTYFACQIAKDKRTQERLSVIRARQTLLRDVRVRYARFAADLRQEKLWQTAVLAAQELLKVAQSWEREGLNAAADTAQVKATVAEAAKQLLQAQTQAQESRLLLAQTLSLPAHAGFTIEQDLPPLPEPLTAEQLAQLEQRALKTRPELLVQDLERHVAATTVRREFAGFFPRVDGLAGFNWTSSSFQVNPAYFTYGIGVANSLLEGGSRYFRFREAQQNVRVEERQALVLALGILYQLDLSAVQVARTYNDLRTSQLTVATRQVVLKQISSRYREGLEVGADLARSVAELHGAMLYLDRAQTDYLVAWYELRAAAPDEEPPAGLEDGKTPDGMPEQAAAAAPAPVASQELRSVPGQGGTPEAKPAGALPAALGALEAKESGE